MNNSSPYAIKSVLKTPVPSATIESNAGKIWLIPREHYGSEKYQAIDPEFVVGVWTAWSPLSHPGWDMYRVAVYHLRDVTPEDNRHKMFERATHEFSVIALSPDDEEIDVNDPFTGTVIPPGTIQLQFIAESDAHAFSLVENLLIDTIEGAFSLSAAWTPQWQAELMRPRVQPRLN